MSVSPSRLRRHARAALVLLLLAAITSLSACGDATRGDEPGAEGTPGEETPAETEETVDTTPGSDLGGGPDAGSAGPEDIPGPAQAAPGAAPDDGLAGRWWLLAPDLSYLAFRVDLRETGLAHHWSGHWRSFDWRGTRRAQSPYRLSSPVAFQARRTGDELQLHGPAPQLDADGRPNGASGTWTARLEPVTDPEGAPSWRGTLVHRPAPSGEGLTPPAGVEVGLVRTMVLWER